MPLEPKLADLPRIRGALRFYQVAAIITGVLLLLLCAEMIMKYAFGLELELGGPNGFLAFVPIDTVTAVNLSTGISTTMIPPFALRLRSRAADRSPSTAVTGSAPAPRDQRSIATDR